MNYTINRIAQQLWKIKHWEIRSASFEEIENQKATWFIDPPYQFGGHAYKCSNKYIDYSFLKTWCLSRAGQIIVCENSKATWMDFNHMVNQNCYSGLQKEVIWTNEKSEFDNIQLKFFT